MKKDFLFKFVGIAIPFLALILTGCVIPFPSSTSTPSIPNTSLILSESPSSSTSESSSSLSSSSMPESSASSSTSESSSSLNSSSMPESSASSSTSESSSSLLASSASMDSTASEDLSSQPLYQGYYQAVNGVNDAQLKPTLTTILRGILDSNGFFISTTYGNARYDLPLSDADPNNPNNIILVYSRQSVSSTWDAGTTWNREHVYPQSLMNVKTENSSRHKGADYHNIKPENPGVNTSRGNKYFAETTTTKSYAPPSVVRGDVARILFYMVTMWPELSLVDVIESFEPATFQMAQLSLLVKWHLEDPVDAFEANRNEVIYGFQGNRNPFIDHQEFVCRVWGPSNINTQGYCAA